MTTNNKTDVAAGAYSKHVSEAAVASDIADLPRAIDKALAAGEAVQMRSTLDEMPVLKALRVFWKVGSMCMLAAFASALEGYRTPPS